MALFLGIDGGGSGCRAALADQEGRLLGRGVAGPANVNTDLPSARLAILEAARQAVSSAVGEAKVAETFPRLTAGLGLAGANAADVAGQLVRDLPFGRTRIETDAVTTALGALGGGNGIVAAIGTGSVFASVQGGEFRQIGGWGMVLGDEGSAAVLGRSILSYALRAYDGHAGMSPFLETLLHDFGGPSGVVTFAQKARPADFAALAPRVTGSEDPAAQLLMKTATQHVASFIRLLRDGTDLPVVFTGGLGPVYRERLSLTETWTIHDAVGTSLDGALILAREAA